MKFLGSSKTVFPGVQEVSEDIPRCSFRWKKSVPLSFHVQIEGKLRETVVVLGNGMLLSFVIMFRKQVSVKPFRDPRTLHRT